MQNNCKRTHCLWLVFSLLAALPALPLQALPQVLLDTWVLRQQSQSWPNGQYRYRVLSFWQQGQEVEYLDFRIYPRSDVRSIMVRGRAKQQGQQTLVLEEQQQVRILNEGKGFPTYFSRELKELSSQKEHEFSIRDGHVLELKGGAIFEHYAQSWAKAQKHNDVTMAMDLFALHGYMIQSQVPNFGSVKMMKNSDTVVPGLISGQMMLDFEARGLLGMANSGLWFKFTEFKQLAHVRINGSQFGGANRMEGVLQLIVHGQHVFTVDYRQVKIKRGYGSSGTFLANFPDGPKYSVHVGRYGQ